jgi:hypothetical protein
MQNSKFTLLLMAAAIALPIAAISGKASAFSVTQDSVAASLASALLSGSPDLTVTGSSLSGQTSGGAVSSGTYTNGSGTYGVGSGVILSSGNVSDYGDGANTAPGFTTNFGPGATGAQEALLDLITGGGFDHFDVTQLDLTFDVGAGVTSVFFNVVFGSDEFAEFVGSPFIDAFGIYLNGGNIATFPGDLVNIDHPSMAFIGGMGLDGILDPTAGAGDPIMLFQGNVIGGSTGNALTFIIADSGDTQLDSTVYIEGFDTSDPGGGTPGGGDSIPEPALRAALFVCAVQPRISTMPAAPSTRRRMPSAKVSISVSSRWTSGIPASTQPAVITASAWALTMAAGARPRWASCSRLNDPAVDPLPDRHTTTRPATHSPSSGWPVSITMPVASSTPRLNAMPATVTRAAPSPIPSTSPFPLNFFAINPMSSLRPYKCSIWSRASSPVCRFVRAVRNQAAGTGRASTIFTTATGYSRGVA